MTADFRVKVAVRNNCLLEAIEAAGYRCGGKFAKVAGVAYTELVALASMRDSPINQDGRWRSIALKLSEFLRVLPEDLFRDAHLEGLQKSSVERRVDAEQMYALLEDVESADDPVKLLEDKEQKQAVAAALETLPTRPRKVVQRRMMGATIAEIADEFEVTPSRIREIEARAYRLLRHPTRAPALREAFTGEQEREATPEPQDDVEWTIHEPPKPPEPPKPEPPPPKELPVHLRPGFDPRYHVHEFQG